MCYSAMVRQDMSKVARSFGAKVDHSSFVHLYRMRLKDPELKIPVGMDHYFLSQKGQDATLIKSAIENFREAEEKRCAQEIEDLEAEIREIEQKLKIKVTKTGQNSLGVKERKRGKLLQQAKSATKISSSSESYRIYPKYFAPVIVEVGKELLLRPMRYRIIPANGFEIPSKFNVFNARRDSLQSAKTWKAVFGKKHAIFPFEQFYEWVEGKRGEKTELYFSPQGFDSMWAASLFEEYKSPKLGSIYSFAMVTDEPPPEVSAAGHDRCPVFLNESHLSAWLNPKGKSLTELDALLDFKQKTFYENASAA